MDSTASRANDTPATPPNRAVDTVLVLGRETPPKAAVIACLGVGRDVVISPEAAPDHASVVVLAGGDDPLEGIVNDVPDPGRLVAMLTGRRPRHVVLVDSAFVYGAHPSNPVPMGDGALLRPNAGLLGMQRQAELERRLRGVAADRGMNLTVLRCAPVVGRWPGGTAPFGAESWVGLRGGNGPCQFLHEGDLALAVRHVLESRLTGTFDVAPDGWITSEEIDAITGRRRPVVRLPSDAYVRWSARRHAGRSREAAAAGAALLRYPVVVANTSLRRSGWQVERTNAMALRVACDADREAQRDRARRRRRVTRPVLVLVLGAFGAAAAGYSRTQRRRLAGI